MPWQQQSKDSNIEAMVVHPETQIKSGASVSLHSAILQKYHVLQIWWDRMQLVDPRADLDCTLPVVCIAMLLGPWDNGTKKHIQLSGTSRAGPKRSTLKEPMAVAVCGLSPPPFFRQNCSGINEQWRI